MRGRYWLFVMAALLLAAAAMPVAGQSLGIDASGGKYYYIGPTIIPVNASGSSGIGVIRIDLQNFDTNPAYVQEVVLDLVGSDSLGTGAADISAVNLYFTTSANKSFPVGGTPPGLIATTLTRNASDFAITVTNPATVLIPASTDNYVMFLTVDYASTVATPNTVEYVIGSITSNSASDGSGTSDVFVPGALDAGGPSSAINEYVVTFAGTDIVAAVNEEEGATDVEVLRLQLGSASDEAVDKELASVTFTYTGTDTADVGATSVKLYRDNGASGTVGSFDAGGTDPLIATGVSWSGSSITLNTTEDNTNNVFNNSASYFFLLVDIADRSGVGVGNTVGFQIADESADITFYDEVDDVITGTDAVAGSTGGEYAQTGYITTSAGISSSLITIDPKTVVDTTPPTIIASTPSDAATGVSRNLATVDLTFDDVLFDDGGGGAPGSVTTLGNYSMQDSGAVAVTLTGVTFDSGSRTATLTIDPTALPLTYSEVYTVTVSNVENTDGYAMTSDSISFTIEPPTPPTVLGTVPGADATDVAINTVLSVIFSEAMDETTITDAANFSLVETDTSQAVAGVMTYSPAGFTATFTPDTAFDYDTRYTATLTSGILDAEGTALAADYSWSFTTGSAAAGLSFTDIIVANNRITPGSTEPMRIFIETPEGASDSDPVTIAVYTTTGRRVATLTTAGETYADVIARQPILWSGTNGRGQDLGPGLYFIQVSSNGIRRALRVMIVR